MLAVYVYIAIISMLIWAEWVLPCLKKQRFLTAFCGVLRKLFCAGAFRPDSKYHLII